MTEMNVFKEFVICSVNELRDEDILMAETTSFQLHLSSNENGIGGSVTFHKTKLHIIYLNLLPNSVLKDPFHWRIKQK